MVTMGGRPQGRSSDHAPHRSQCLCWGRKKHPGRVSHPRRGGGGGRFGERGAGDLLPGAPAPTAPSTATSAHGKGSFSAPPLPFPVPPPRSFGVSGSPHPPLPRACARRVSPTWSPRLSSDLWRRRMRARGLYLFTCRARSPQCPALTHLSCVSWGSAAVSHRFAPTLRVSHSGFCLSFPASR